MALYTPIVAVLLLLSSAVAEARVTRIEVTRREPFAGAQAFGSAGPYEKVVGRFYSELAHVSLIRDERVG